MSSIHDWQRLTGPELAALASRDPVAVLPMAAIEQHGPHLPLDTDVRIGHGLVEAARADLATRDIAAPVIVLPMMTLGASLEHTGFAGTLSLSGEQAMATLRAYGESVARAGIKRLVIFNSHGGNKAAIDMAALQLRADHGLLVVKASYFRFTPPDDTLAAEELRHGLHGGALETAMLWHLAPESIRADQLANFPSYGAERAAAGHTLGPEGDAGFAWLAEDLNPEGVTGNAATATAEQGARLVASFGARLADIIAEAAGFDLARLG